MKTNPSYSSVRCPICGHEIRSKLFRTTRGKLLFHLKRRHNKSQLEAEMITCNTMFGEEVVQYHLERYKKGELCIYDITAHHDKEGCPDISKLITLMGLKRTSKEERQTARYKKHYIESIQKKFGPNITNVSQVKSVQQKKMNTFAKHWGSYENYLENAREKMLVASKEKWADPEFKAYMKEKIEQVFQKKYGENIKNPSQIPSVKSKISERQKERYAVLTDDELRAITKHGREKHMQTLHSLSSKDERKKYLGIDKITYDWKSSGPTSILEKRVQNVLISQKINFEHNKFLFKKSWDILFPTYKIILEIQGNYYHANPKFYKENDVLIYRGGIERVAKDIWKRDADRKLLVEQNGWKMRYLWESDINYCLTEATLLELVKSVIPEIFESSTNP